MTFVDYYQVLEIAPDADADTVRQAVRRQRTEWRRKAGHPKQDVRALAERYTQNISDAETILLDESRRADYDRQYAARSEEPAPAAAGSDRDWVRIAREYLDAGNASSANYAAREATAVAPEDPESWYLRGASSSILGNAADAEYELGEAARLRPNEPSYHCELGDLYAANGMPDRAQAAYQRASDLAPDDRFYQVGVASALVAQGELTKALPVLESAVSAEPHNELFAYHLAIALADSTVEQWSEYADGSRSILNEAQLWLTQKNLARIRSLPVKDPELAAHVDELDRHAGNAQRISWYGSSNILLYLVGAVGAAIAMFVSFAVGGRGGGILFGLLFLAVAVIVVMVFVRRHRMPGWKWEAAHAPAFVRRSGRQPGASQ